MVLCVSLIVYVKKPDGLSMVNHKAYDTLHIFVRRIQRTQISDILRRHINGFYPPLSRFFEKYLLRYFTCISVL